MGKNIINIPYGFTFFTLFIASPIIPKLSANLPINIPITNNIGVNGIPVFLFISRTKPDRVRPANKNSIINDSDGIISC